MCIMVDQYFWGGMAKAVVNRVRSKWVRTLGVLLRSLSNKDPWESYEAAYLPSLIE